MQCREGQGTSSEDVLCKEGVMPETLGSMISYQSAWLIISATILSLPSCAAPTPIPAPISTQPAPVGMVLIPAGDFSMGSVDSLARADERPIHRVRLNAFWMDATEVTNRQFAKFIDATGYKTMAERPVDWDELKWRRSFSAASRTSSAMGGSVSCRQRKKPRDPSSISPV